MNKGIREIEWFYLRVVAECESEVRVAEVRTFDGSDSTSTGTGFRVILLFGSTRKGVDCCSEPAASNSTTTLDFFRSIGKPYPCTVPSSSGLEAKAYGLLPSNSGFLSSPYELLFSESPFFGAGEARIRKNLSRLSLRRKHRAQMTKSSSRTARMIPMPRPAFAPVDSPFGSEGKLDEVGLGSETRVAGDKLFSRLLVVWEDVVVIVREVEVLATRVTAE